MREITHEIREKIVAMYWGQQVLKLPNLEQHTYIVGKELEVRVVETGAWLELKALSSITDEDAIEVAHSCTIGIGFAFDRDAIRKGKRITRMAHATLPSGAVDYLRSKGYALSDMAIQ